MGLMWHPPRNEPETPKSEDGERQATEQPEEVITVGGSDSAASDEPAKA